MVLQRTPSARESYLARSNVCVESLGRSRRSSAGYAPAADGTRANAAGGCDGAARAYARHCPPPLSAASIRPDWTLLLHQPRQSRSRLERDGDGFRGHFGFAAGGAISENNILAVAFLGHGLTSPTASSEGRRHGSTVPVTLWAIVPLYIPLHERQLVLSSRPSLSRMSVSSGGNTANTTFGFGACRLPGMSGWVSDHWGLGLGSATSR